MAIDIYSPSFISPRISFSLDLNNQPSQTTTTSTAATTDTFDFCIPLNLESPVTSADELFLDGVLLPTHIKKPKQPVSENDQALDHVHRKRLKELLSHYEEEQEAKCLTRSFWKFTRTTSLNSGNASRPKRLIRSFSLKRLLHNNSTLNSRGNESNEDVMKVVKKSNSRKEMSSSPGRLGYGCNGGDSRRPSVGKKDSGGGNQVNDVLNGSAGFNMNLFGYGSLFCKGKHKSKSK